MQDVTDDFENLPLVQRKIALRLIHRFHKYNDVWAPELKALIRKDIITMIKNPQSALWFKCFDRLGKMNSNMRGLADDMSANLDAKTTEIENTALAEQLNELLQLTEDMDSSTILNAIVKLNVEQREKLEKLTNELAALGTSFLDAFSEQKFDLRTEIEKVLGLWVSQARTGEEKSVLTEQAATAKIPRRKRNARARNRFVDALRQQQPEVTQQPKPKPNTRLKKPQKPPVTFNTISNLDDDDDDVNQDIKVPEIELKRPAPIPIVVPVEEVDQGGENIRSIYCGLDRANKPPNAIFGNPLQCLRKGYAIGSRHVRT